MGNLFIAWREFARTAAGQSALCLLFNMGYRTPARGSERFGEMQLHGEEEPLYSKRSLCFNLVPKKLQSGLTGFRFGLCCRQKKSIAWALFSEGTSTKVVFTDGRVCAFPLLPLLIVYRLPGCAKSKMLPCTFLVTKKAMPT